MNMKYKYEHACLRNEEFTVNRQGPFRLNKFVSSLCFQKQPIKAKKQKKCSLEMDGSHSGGRKEGRVTYHFLIDPGREDPIAFYSAEKLIKMKCSNFYFHYKRQI